MSAEPDRKNPGADDFEDPHLRAWRALAARIQVDPRFPIPIEISVDPWWESPRRMRKVRIRCVLTSEDATAPVLVESCDSSRTGGDAPATSHRKPPIHFVSPRFAPLVVPDAEKIDRIVDLLHAAVAHELDEFVRIDGRLARDPHAPVYFQPNRAALRAGVVIQRLAPRTRAMDPDSKDAPID